MTVDRPDLDPKTSIRRVMETLPGVNAGAASEAVEERLLRDGYNILYSDPSRVDRPDLDAIREAHIHVERVGTHFDGCYLSHRPCAIAALADEVDRLNRLCGRLAMEGASETEERWRLEAERDHWRSVAEEREGRVMYWQDRALGGAA